MIGSRVKLMELREYVSERTGNHYFSGFLGKARVVVLRDDRAECTGKEVARWSMLLEEAEPREGERPARVDGGSRRRRNGLTASVSAPMPEGAPRARNTSAERHAGRMLRERGIDPDAELSRDEIPF